MHDLVIRGGTVVDGSGGPAATADVAVTGGTITEVGRVEGRARREVDADGLLVTPGFVDVHTHFDGQATWDPHLTPMMDEEGRGVLQVVPAGISGERGGDAKGATRGELDWILRDGEAFGEAGVGAATSAGVQTCAELGESVAPGPVSGRRGKNRAPGRANDG